ncbi:MAG: hypothetical protein ABH858_05755, partial [Candidatus Omnitrophota bacterium]
MKQRHAVYVTAIIFIFSFSACDNLPFGKKPKKPAQKQSKFSAVTGTVIARVNDYPITLEDLNEEIDRYNIDFAKDNPELKITKAEDKVNYLRNEIIRRILLYQDAVARG